MADITSADLTALQNPYAEQLVGLNRQQALAQMLLQQGQQQLQGQMISGRYVKPSPLQGVNNLLQTAAGLYGQKQAENKQLELAKLVRQKEGEAVNAYTSAQTPQERFAAGTNQYAPAELKKIAYGMIAPQKLAEGETINQLNMGTGQYEPMAQGGQKKTEAIRGYELAKSQGFPGSFFDYEQQLKRAGAPSVINQVGASLAGQAGKLFEESKATTVGGYGAIASADKILNSTNKAITGPLANARLTGLQIADTLGATGKGEKEKLAATREVLQETGKLALAAPPKGQGQVSNYERDLYQRAASGDINFTPTELNLIAKRAKEFGEYQIQQHNELLQAGAELGPDVAKMAKLYKVNPPQTVLPVAPSAPAQTSNKVKFLGFE